MLKVLNTVPFPPVIIIFAYILDLAIGDPEWFPHPVRWIGKAITFLEGLLRKNSDTGAGGKFLGGVLALFITGAAYGIVLALLYFSFRFSRVLFFILSTYFVWASISIKSLKKEAKAVVSVLNSDGLAKARKKLSRIVGRDTSDLPAEGVLKAVVETVSENTSDGIVAPLFYLAIGGPPLAFAYKAVNTLDSMVGYRNERYINFGLVSARLDDLVNFIPARFTAFLMVCASFILGYNWKGSLKILKRDRRNHPSPNSGCPEAAVAGALGVRLGGPMSYGGLLCEKPFIGDNSYKIDASTVNSSVRIMNVTAFLMVALTLVIRVIIIFLL